MIPFPIQQAIEITGGAYDGLLVSDDMELYALSSGRKIAPGALSAGAMEQLYFAFRLAVIRCLWPHEEMPLFFDDSFADGFIVSQGVHNFHSCRYRDFNHYYHNHNNDNDNHHYDHNDHHNHNDHCGLRGAGGGYGIVYDLLRYNF